MSKASKIVVLCEDRAHEIFVTRFLKKGWNVKPRSIRVLPYPGAKGSGKKHVENSLAGEVEAFRGRHASTILLVVRDADEQSVNQARLLLDAKFQPPRAENEQIAFIIPKWHIETWIAWLGGKDVDEGEKGTYKNAYGRISVSKEAHPLIDQLAVDCKENRELESPPDSLVAACEEFKRIRDAL